MTTEEYYKALHKHESAISRKRQLLMTIRMNAEWSFQKKTSKKKIRQEVIDNAKKELNSLVIPPKPVKVIKGYEVYLGNDWDGFIETQDITEAQEQAQEYYNNTQYELKPVYVD